MAIEDWFSTPIVGGGAIWNPPTKEDNLKEWNPERVPDSSKPVQGAPLQRGVIPSRTVTPNPQTPPVPTSDPGAPGNSLGIIPITPPGSIVARPDGNAGHAATGVVPSAQDLARQKELQNQATVKQADQQQRQNITKGGTPVTIDPQSDPAGHIAQRTQNVASGVGTSTGMTPTDTPQAPTENETRTAAVAKQGAQQSFEQNKVGEWYKSQSFGLGLMSFGLSLLSGQDLIHSFAAGSGAFTQARGQEIRTAHGPELLQQGYPQWLIDQYVQTGDDKVFSNYQDSLYKQAQTQHELSQVPLEQQKLANETYKVIQTGEHNKAEEAHWNQSDLNNQVANQIKMTGNQIEINKNMSKQQQTQIFGQADPEAIGSMLGRQQNDTQQVQDIARVKLADETVGDLRDALQNWDKSGDALTQLGRENIAKMFKGGYGGITEGQFATYAGNPSQVTAAMDWINRGMTGKPTKETADLLLKVAQRAHNDRMKVLQDSYDSMVSTLRMQGVPDQTAGQIALRAYPSISNKLRIYQPEQPKSSGGQGGMQPQASANNITVLN